MKTEYRKIGDFYGVVYHDVDNNKVTIATKGKVGAIISGESLIEAEDKYKKAMQLYCAAVSLKHFKETGELLKPEDIQYEIYE